MASFHDAHFGTAALDTFAKDFLDPNKLKHHGDEEEVYEEEEYYEEEEDDELGYYPDGVKRTLTDDQIAMFRHSELQALERAREKAKDNGNPATTTTTSHNGDCEDGELPEDGLIQTSLLKTSTTTKKKNKKRRGKGKGNTDAKPWSPDPERRKRTWDVVETGLDGLDYGETGASESPAEHVAQRRRITYDDD